MSIKLNYIKKYNINSLKLLQKILSYDKLNLKYIKNILNYINRGVKNEFFNFKSKV